MIQSLNHSILHRPPWWVWVIAAILASTQPLLILWVTHAPPEGTAPTSLHITDSALFLYSMHMFETGFSPEHYATCKTPAGTRDLASTFPVPHLWLYGALGWMTLWTGLSDIHIYGLANGLGTFLYLLAVFWFLCEVLPKHARLAFALFAASGGPGGVLYIITGILGVHGSPWFEDVFRRYALYELFEGPHLLPILHMPRLYYTLSLALCLSAFTACIRAFRAVNPSRYAHAAPLMALGMFINLRFGVFVLGIAGLFFLSQTDRPLAKRAWRFAGLAVPGLVGAVPAWLLLHSNPAVVQNHMQVGNVAMWLSPFVSVALFHLLLLPAELRRRLPALAPWTELCAWASVGYLAAFAVLFGAYQVYYGNLLVARDGAVAVAVSDWALVGALCGAAYALATRARRTSGATDWVLLWLLGGLAVSISAFGRGGFLRYGPQRIEVLLWLPLCMLSAAALHRMFTSKPRLARALLAIMIVCGISSTAVSALCFQGPLDFRAGVSPYAAYHSEVMTTADAHTMSAIGEGMVLAPIPASDVIVRTQGNPTVFGTGSFNLTDQPYAPLCDQVHAFFSPDATDGSRRAFVKEWCVDYVYCPDTWPLQVETVEQLRKTPWLVEIASEGRAALFLVVGSEPRGRG